MTPTVLTRRAFAVFAACACLPTTALGEDSAPSGKFICPPCGCSYDGKLFDKPGVCPDGACAMELIPAPDPAPAPAPARPPNG